MSESLDGLEATYRDWQDAEINWEKWFKRNRVALNASLKITLKEYRQGYFSDLSVEQVLLAAQNRWLGGGGG